MSGVIVGNFIFFFTAAVRRGDDWVLGEREFCLSAYVVRGVHRSIIFASRDRACFRILAIFEYGVWIEI